MTAPKMLARSCMPVLLPALLAFGGCSVVALPFRVTGDVIGVVPVIGKPLGAPVRAVGDVID